MENQEQLQKLANENVVLKAKVYDLSEQVQGQGSILGQIAEKLEVETIEALFEKLESLLVEE